MSWTVRYVAEKTIPGLEVEFGFGQGAVGNATRRPLCLSAASCCLHTVLI